MEKNDTLKNLLVAGAIVVVVLTIGQALLPPPKPPAQGTVDPTSGSQMAQSVGSPADAPSEPDDSPPSTGVTPSQANTAGKSPFSIVEAASARSFEIGSGPNDGADANQPESPFRMRLVASNLGAGIESATLTDHAAKLKHPDRYALISPVTSAGGAAYRALSIEKINIEGTDVTLLDKKWQSEGPQPCTTKSGEDGTELKFWMEIEDAGAPALRLERTFQLPKQSKASGRHDLNSALTIQNLSSKPYRVVATFRGGVGVASLREVDDVVLDAGEDAGDGVVAGTRKQRLEAARKAPEPIKLFSLTPSEPNRRLSWSAIGNTYFTCTVSMVGDDGRSPAGYIAEASALDADGDPATHLDVVQRFVTKPVSLAPSSTVNFNASVFLGEKDGHAFRNVPEYRDRNYYYQIAQGFGICTFSWLVELMIMLLNGLFKVVRDFGVAIIILVLVVRTLLHPITKKGQVNMVRMQHQMTELAPKIEELKKKYANDKARLNQEMMKLNINPAGQLMTCLPMFIQMPIWVALYLSLSNNILMRHEPFLFTWVRDLTAPDALIPFSTAFIVPFFGWKIASFNLLPILVSVFMYIQQKTQPKPKPNPNMTEQQRQQQEMMQTMIPIMSVMMLFIFYNMPSGLCLYVMFSSLFGWIEQVRIRAHIREREEAGTLLKPARAVVAPVNADARPARKGFLAGWMERMQKAAEEAQRLQRSQQRSRPKR